MDSWIYILFGFLWFIGVLWWDVQSDYEKWKKEIPIKHTKEMLIRCALLAPAGTALWIGNFSLATLPIVPIMMGSWWWEFFDGWYNKKRDKPWRFNGSVDPDDSRLDSFL